MTERLYYNDSYARAFSSPIAAIEDDGKRVYLERTAFYPTSGGQPFDLGTLGGVAVQEIVDEDDGRVGHVLASPLAASLVTTSGDIKGSIDWARRWDHMQQHTGQHLLSAVLIELFNITTVSFHMSAASSTIDVSAASISAQQAERAEERCAEIIAEARPVTISYEDSAADLGLRKASARTGTLRIVTIENLDRSACGGTHVRSTAELGPILLRKIDKMRGNARIEFVCGLRALRAARRDYRSLADIGKLVSGPVEDAAALAAAQIERAKGFEKTALRLAAELAKREGAELYASTAPDANGLRVHTHRGLIDDATRTRAQAFVAGSQAVFLAISNDPPAILLASSADSGIHAGERVKAAVTAAGGRGGGNQALAQGSLPDAKSLDAIAATLLQQS